MLMAAPLGTVLVLISLVFGLSVAHKCVTISLGSVDTCKSLNDSCYKSFEEMRERQSSLVLVPPYGGKKCYRLEVHGPAVHSLTLGVWRVSDMESFSVIGMNINSNTIRCSNESRIVLEDIVNVVLDNVQFVNCGITQGQQSEAAMAAVTVGGSRPVNLVSVTNCSFVNEYNNGHHNTTSGGGLMINLSNNTTHNSRRVVYLTDCLFKGNRATIGGGSYMNITGDMLLLIKGCQFIDNKAVLVGGGVYINIHHATNNTLLKIDNSQFMDNTAGLTGGGAYVNTSHHPKLDLIMTHVTFANNSSPCVSDLAYEDTPSLLRNRTITHSSVVGPKVVPYYWQAEMELCIGQNSWNHSCCNVGEVCDISLMLGQRMYLSLTVASVDSSIDGNNYAVVQKLLPEYNYSLVGMNVIQINSTQSKLEQVPFYISLNSTHHHYKENDTVILNITSIVPDSWFFQVNVTLKNCSFGYLLLNTNSSICQCFESDDVVCDDHKYTTCVRFGHWFGEIHDNYTVTECLFGSCNYAVSNQCPIGTSDCYINDKKYPFFCTINSSDDVCLYDKAGAMCSQCKDGFHPSFPDMMCIHEDHCHDWYVALQTFLYILYLFVAVILVLAAVKFDFRIESGQIYCLVFYFSVFEYFIGGVFPSKTLYFVNVIISGVLQFNPAILGMLPLCAENLHLNRFNEIIIQLCNPVVLALAILGIVLISKKFQIWQNSRLGINALCIMLYLCFISITQTTLVLLHPITLPPLPGVYTFLDPTKHYFGLDHLPYAVISLLLQLVLVLPFLFLLLFSPFLVRFRRLNLTRIKPILDEFQACYKTEYRYFAGFYLTCRQLIFFMSFVSLGNFGYIYVLQILSIFILAIHYCVQPYKSKALNVIDGLLILDLVLLSILHGNTAQVVFKNIIQLKETLVYLLVLLPVVYFVLLCINPFIRRIRIPFFKKFKAFRIDRVDGYEQPSPDLIGAAPITCSVVGLRNSGNYSPQTKIVTEREPLLFSRSKR